MLLNTGINIQQQRQEFTNGSRTDQSCEAKQESHHWQQLQRQQIHGKRSGKTAKAQTQQQKLQPQKNGERDREKEPFELVQEQEILMKGTEPECE